MKEVWLSTAYTGSLDYWAAIIQSNSLILETQESFSKQSYRNRCYIDSPNGPLMLNLPIKHGSASKIDEIAISYQEDWPLKHWQAIQTSYGQSPFFEAIAEDLQAILFQRYSNLWSLNEALRQQIAQWLRVDLPIEYTQGWNPTPSNPTVLDWREQIHPKKPSVVAAFPTYPQEFDHKHGFLANLSILDLLFQEGPAAYDYLKDLEFVISTE